MHCWLKGCPKKASFVRDMRAVTVRQSLKESRIKRHEISKALRMRCFASGYAERPSDAAPLKQCVVVAMQGVMFRAFLIS